MPYFPKNESAYHCEGCGGWYYRGNMMCLVAHAPGSCCHEHEMPAPTPIRTGIVGVGVSLREPPSWPRQGEKRVEVGGQVGERFYSPYQDAEYRKFATEQLGDLVLFLEINSPGFWLDR